MSADGGHLEFPIRTKNITFIDGHQTIIHAMFTLNWFTVFKEFFFNIFPYGSNVKTMSADVGHLEIRISTKNITFVDVHPMIIHAMFALNWFTGVRIFFKHFPSCPMLKLCLRWRPSWISDWYKKHNFCRGLSKCPKMLHNGIFSTVIKKSPYYLLSWKRYKIGRLLKDKTTEFGNTFICIGVYRSFPNMKTIMSSRTNFQKSIKKKSGNYHIRHLGGQMGNFFRHFNFLSAKPIKPTLFKNSASVT